VILACAGLNRLGLQERIRLALGVQTMVPASGQGALAVATRHADHRFYELLAPLHHRPTALAVAAERAFLGRVGGGCNSPVAVHAALERGLLHITGLVATPDGATVIRESVAQAPHAADQAAVALADRILVRGGRAILRALR
jgi:hydroxymethylbilane synthase